MKKPIILSVLFFILTSISSFGQVLDGVDREQQEAIENNSLALNNLARTLHPILKPEFLLSYLENGERFGITPEQAAAITSNTARGEAAAEQIAIVGETYRGITEQLTALGQNDTEIGKQLTALGQNDTAIGEQMTKLGQNDESIMAEINAMKAQLQTLVASIAEKDAEIVELKKRPTLEQVRDARAGSVVLTVEPDGNNITLGLTIEQSDNLTEWTKLDGEMTRTIPIPDGKKFYRFALDK